MVDRRTVRAGLACLLGLAGALGTAGCGAGPAGTPGVSPAPRRTGVLESTMLATDALPSATAMISLDRHWQTAEDATRGWSRPDVVAGRAADENCRQAWGRDCPGLTMMGGAGYDLAYGRSVRARASFTLYVFDTAGAARAGMDTLLARTGTERPRTVALPAASDATTARAYATPGRTPHRIESLTRTGTVVTVVDYRATPATAATAGALVALQASRLRTVLSGREPAL